MSCSICGQSGYVRCNCVSAQPFCDQCDDSAVCIEKMDSACVIYHFAIPGHTPPPTRLINLGMPNGSSAEAIFERIDQYLVGNRPWTVANTPTLVLNLNETGVPSILTGNVQVSSTAGNILIADAHGLYVPDFTESGRVKVSAIDPLLYLEDSMFGGTDGCVTLDITRDTASGRLFLQPTISAQCLFQNLFSVIDSNSIHLNLNTSGVPVTLQATSKISATAGNVLVVNADGLFVPASVAPPGFTINNNADNRLITANGSSTSADAEATLLYDSTAGTLSAPLFTPSLAATNPSYMRASFVAGLNFNQANYGVKVGNMAGVFGEMLYNSSVNTTFGRGYYVGGVIADPALNTVNGTTTTGLLAGLVAKMDMFGNGVYTDIANIRTSFPATDAALGGIYTGSITNYYALFIGAKNGDEGGITPVPTNAYAIFQEGSALKNSFATAVVVTSDERIKTVESSYGRGLAEIEALAPVYYHFNESPTKETKVGLLAQAVEVVIPEAIHTEDNAYYGIEDFKKLDTDTLVYTLVNAVKELSALNKSLTERIAVLEAK